MRGTAAPILLKRRWNLDDLLFHQRGFDDHFAGKLHARCSESETVVGFSREGAHAAMEIADLSMEQQAAQLAEHWIAEVAV